MLRNLTYRTENQSPISNLFTFHSSQSNSPTFPTDTGQLDHEVSMTSRVVHLNDASSVHQIRHSEQSDACQGAGNKVELSPTSRELSARLTTSPRRRVTFDVVVSKSPNINRRRRRSTNNNVVNVTKGFEVSDAALKQGENIEHPDQQYAVCCPRCGDQYCASMSLKPAKRPQKESISSNNEQISQHRRLSTRIKLPCVDPSESSPLRCENDFVSLRGKENPVSTCPACGLLFQPSNHTTSEKNNSPQRNPFQITPSNRQENNVDVPSLVQSNVSKFIPNDQILPIDTDDEQTYNLYVESFVHNCRLEHMVMVMGLHPQYLKQFLHTNLHLLQAKGVLSYQYRSYIAIMAAARHRCTYLVHLMEAHFLLQGGDRDWLRGLDYVPAKLRALSKLNKFLAHRPWLVTSKHIKELIMEGDPSSRWQHPELAQAVTLLCHFHSVAIFCHGAGINLEIDHERAHRFSHSPLQRRSSSPPSGSNTPNNYSGGHSPGTPTSSNSENSMEQPGDIDVLMERMKRIQEEEEEEVTREEMNRRFEKEKEEATQLTGGVGSRIGGASYFSRYVIDPDYSYQDFAKRDAPEDIPTFREQDYSWDDSASLMINNYNSEVADLLDEKFKTAYLLTYKTLATKDNVDTSSLRRAIWNYVHCLYGIMYDDYNYGEVNQLLERPLKVFIKTATCFPEQMKRNVYDGFWKQFRHSEKVHVNIMLLEARLQVGLLYGMRAITEFVSSS